MIFGITPIIIAKIMGNAFLNAPVFHDESPILTWHIGLFLIGSLITKNLLGLCVSRFRKIRNSAMAKKMLAERNDKHFEFKNISADELKTMDVTQIRNALLEEKYTSVDLVNYFGSRV